MRLVRTQPRPFRQSSWRPHSRVGQAQQRHYAHVIEEPVPSDRRASDEMMSEARRTGASGNSPLGPDPTAEHDERDGGRRSARPALRRGRAPANGADPVATAQALEAIDGADLVGDTSSMRTTPASGDVSHSR
jgi:hypothetical protein